MERLDPDTPVPPDPHAGGAAGADCATGGAALPQGRPEDLHSTGAGVAGRKRRGVAPAEEADGLARGRGGKRARVGAKTAAAARVEDSVDIGAADKQGAHDATAGAVACAAAKSEAEAIMHVAKEVLFAPLVLEPQDRSDSLMALQQMQREVGGVAPNFKAFRRRGGGVPPTAAATPAAPIPMHQYDLFKRDESTAEFDRSEQKRLQRQQRADELFNAVVPANKRRTATALSSRPTQAAARTPSVTSMMYDSSKPSQAALESPADPQEYSGAFALPHAPATATTQRGSRVGGRLGSSQAMPPPPSTSKNSSAPKAQSNILNFLRSTSKR